MSLTNASILSGATYTPSGGSAISFAPSGRQVSGGLELVCTNDTNPLTRRTMQLKSSLPELPASANAFARLGKNSLVYVVPFIAADGKLYRQTYTLTEAVHPEYTQAAARRNETIAMKADSDFDNFWQYYILT